MTYGVLTILLGVVIFLATKFIPKQFKRPDLREEANEVSETQPDKQHVEETPEILAQWVLNLEKAKTGLKEKLCLMPVFSHSPMLFGRDELLIELFQSINKGKSLIELCGKPGIGKTSLALEVVRRHKYNFKNVKLYLDLGGEDGLSTRDAMIQVVLSFRPTVHIPGNLTQLKKLYQSMMSKRRGFLILGNVASSKQVKDLKPSASSSWLTIFTTGDKLNVGESLSISVEPLDVESAQNFLIDCSLRLKPRAREIAKLCRGIPLALQICGNFLSNKMKVHPEDFVNLFRKYQNNSLLERSDEHEESLLAAFKAIYHSLSDKEKMVFNQLAVFPSSFDPMAATQICEENGSSLKSLSQFGLVRTNPITKRHILHSWIKSQLNNYLPATIAREARLRHANYYLPVLNAAHEKISRGGKKACEGFQLFHREWKNIQAGLNWVRKNSVEGKKAAELFNSYIASVAKLLPLRYTPKDCLSFLDAGLKVSQRLKTTNSEAIHLLNLGIFHRSQNKYGLAEECFQQANQLSTAPEEASTRGKVFNEMAGLYLAQGKANEAINILSQKRKSCLENKIEVDEEVSLMILGLAYEKNEDFEKAIQTMIEGKRKAKTCENGPCMETLLKHLGYCLGRLNKVTNAEDYFEASLKLARALGNKKDEMEILLRFGKVYTELRDSERALSLIGEGLELAEKCRDKKYEGLFLIQMGDIFTRMNENQKAMENYMNALEPLKNSKELVLADAINQKLSRSFELKEENTEHFVTNRVLKPVQKLSHGKGLVLVQAKTEEFIQRGDDKLISYYIGSIEKIIDTYSLDIKQTTTRESLAELMGTLRKNNHHACATVLKNKFSL